MAQYRKHGSIVDRLILLSDPERQDPSPGIGMGAGRLNRFLVLAERHGVLGPVLANLQRPDEPAAQVVFEAAVSRHNAAIGLCLMLRQMAVSVMDGVNAAGVAATIVKGPVFARHLYAKPSLRTYTDIDFLARGSGLDWVRDGLLARGLRPDGEIDPSAREWKFYSPDYPHMAIEVHSDLIHSRSLGTQLRLTYSDIVEGDDPDSVSAPAPLLTVAAVHGAAHQFDRLRQVTDIVQAARHLTDAADERRLQDIAEKTGTRFAIAAALNIAGHIYGDRRCHEIAQALGPIDRGNLIPRLINRTVVVAMQQRTRTIHTWRRSVLREMLKKDRSFAARSATRA